MTETSRVQKLLTEQTAEIDRLKNRIEKLEAALREIVEKTRDTHPMSYLADYFRIASAALAGKNTKD